MSAADAIAKRLEDAFVHIRDTRMADVPILNDRLDVAAIGFRPHMLGGKPGHLGALVTPWFINLVAMADDAEADDSQADDSQADGATGGLPVTKTIEHVFPAGKFPFLVCEEGALGRFAMCSLFSPVHEFEDQAAALAVAQAALDELFDGTAPEPTEEEAAMATMWQEGRWVAPAPQPEPDLTDDPVPSRRAVITAGLASSPPSGETAE